MIVLYRQAKRARRRAGTGAQVVAAYEVEWATPNALPAGITQLPAIVDGDRVIYSEAMPAYLAALGASWPNGANSRSRLLL